MIGDRVLIKQCHKKYAEKIFEIYSDKKVKKKIIGIGGNPGSGKTEIAEELLHIYGNKGLCVIVLHLDDYYIFCPSNRENKRKSTGIVGVREIRWDMLNGVIEGFKTGGDIGISLYHRYNGRTASTILHKSKHIDVLIIEGLYACYDKLNTDIKIHVETTLKETYEFRKERGKENPDSEWRKSILAKEVRAVTYLKQFADKVIGDAMS